MRMENQPKTRKESKKNPKEKGQGQNGKYSAKHVRLQTVKNGFGQSNKVRS